MPVSQTYIVLFKYGIVYSKCIQNANEHVIVVSKCKSQKTETVSYYPSLQYSLEIFQKRKMSTNIRNSTG